MSVREPSLLGQRHAEAQALRGNKGQLAAYDSQGHCVVLAGPGSGKTKVLTLKMARMLAEDVRPPRGVACITYNNECARELQRRLYQLGVRESQRIFIGTVHSFCLQKVILPYARLAGLRLSEPIRIASQKDQLDSLAAALTACGVENSNPRDWETGIDLYRRNHPNRWDSSWSDEDSLPACISKFYEDDLHSRGRVDFDDMAIWGLNLIEGYGWIRNLLKARFPILVVDEYQDLGVLLHRIVLSLCFGAGVRLFAVGDPDQSIYSFTGANPRLLHELSERPDVQTVRLQLNYRCGKNIIRASQIVLAEEREYEAAQDTNQGIVAEPYGCPGNIEEQARIVCSEIVPTALVRRPGRNLSDIAVLYQNKQAGDAIAAAADDHGLDIIRIDQNAPYRKTPLTRWLEDCASWCSEGWRLGEPPFAELTRRGLSFDRQLYSELQFLHRKRQLVQFLWTHRAPNTRLHDWLMDFNECYLEHVFDGQLKLRNDHEDFMQLIASCTVSGRLSDFSVSRFGRQGGAPDHLNLITLHSAKGREFDVVIIPGLDSGKLPHYRATPTGQREARRLFYVGLTRAKHEVHLLYSEATGPSRFLVELWNGLQEA